MRSEAEEAEQARLMQGWRQLAVWNPRAAAAACPALRTLVACAYPPGCRRAYYRFPGVLNERYR